MSVEHKDVIDIVGVDGHTGEVVLTISDHLPWGGEHQSVLQAKLNAYLLFVESGQLLKQYPDAESRSIVICLALKHEPDPAGADFLEKARSIIETVGFCFRVERIAMPGRASAS